MVTGLLMQIIYNIIQNDFSLAYTNLLSIIPNTRYDVHIRHESNQDAIVSPVQDAGFTNVHAYFVDLPQYVGINWVR